MATAGDIQVLQQLVGSPFTFEVPDFQRNYSWEDTQIDALLQDLVEAKGMKPAHFIGSLITMKKENDPSTVLVIDGQQRLTTIFMLVAVLRDAVANMDYSVLKVDDEFSIDVGSNLSNFLFALDANYQRKPRFVAHPMIADLFQDNIIANPLPNRPKLPKSHHGYSLRLRKGHSRLNEWLRAKLSEIPSTDLKLEFINDIFGTISSGISVLQVSTDSTSEAFDIFMSLNSTGLPLGPSDLVKSEIFRILTKDLSTTERAARTKELTEQWQVILLNLENGNVDQFLRHYLLSTQTAKVQSKKIYQNFEKMFSSPEPGLDKKIHVKSILDKLIKASEIYEEILNCNALSSFEGSQALRTLYDIGVSYRVLLMAAFDPELSLSEDERQKLVLATEAFNMRWVLVGKNAQDLETLYQNLTNALRTKEVTISEIIARFKAELPSDDSIKAVFNETVGSPNFVKLILFRVEQLVTGHPQIFEAKKLHLDLVAPQEATSHWLQTMFPDQLDIELEYSATVEQWGNKVLYEHTIPVFAKKLSFQEKVKGVDGFLGYAASNFELTKQLQALSSWSRKSIRDRNDMIGTSVCKIWDLQ